MNTLLSSSAYLALGGFNIAIVDVVALVVLLIFLIVGIVKGFMQQVLSVLGWLAAIIIACLIVEPAVLFVTDSLPEFVEWINGIWEGFVGEQFSSVTNEETLRATLQSSTIPAFLHESIITLVGENYSEVLTTIVSTLTGWTLTAVCFIVIVIVLLIVFALIKKIFKAITSIPVIKKVDKLLGAILGVLEGFILLLIVSVILSVFPWFNDLLTPVAENGESITCIFSVLSETILGLPFIQELLAGISLS